MYQARSSIIEIGTASKSIKGNCVSEVNPENFALLIIHKANLGLELCRKLKQILIAASAILPVVSLVRLKACIESCADTRMYM